MEIRPLDDAMLPRIAQLSGDGARRGTALIAFLVGEVRRLCVSRIDGWYIPTDKNAPASDFYENHAFVRGAPRADGADRWVLDVCQSDLAAPAWLNLRTSASLS